MTKTAAPAKSERQESHPLAPFDIRVLRSGRSEPPPSDPGGIKDLLEEKDTLVWLDIVDPKEADLAPLEKEFGFAGLALEDATTPHERPKIDPYPSYWFLVIQGTTGGEPGIVLHEIAIFARMRLLVTIRSSPAYPLDEIEERLQAHPERCKNGAAFLLYTILDTVVDGYIPVAEQFTESVENIEDALFQSARQMQTDVLPMIFRRKKDAQRFRRAAIPMRDILNQIIREDVSVFPEEEMPYFRDVYDHSIRVIDELDSARDLVSSALEIQLSVTANRQNEVAKQLTIIATIFLPLSFLTGFFGQNFGFLVSHITGADTFLWLGLGSELFAVAALFVFFRVRGWF